VAVLAAIEATGQPHPHLFGLLDTLSDRARSGEGMAESWLAHAEQTDSTDLQFIGQAWLLTERTGAPLADALATAEQALRVRVRTRERVAVVAAGPQASMAVLVALPLGGPLVGLAFGVGPADLYFSSTSATASAVLGIGLAGLGWWWGRRIMARALATRDRARE
jgi:tight adherence protein B